MVYREPRERIWAEGKNFKKKKKNQMEILELKKQIDVLERAEIVEELMILKTLI